jgi:hypothetical protein
MPQALWLERSSRWRCSDDDPLHAARAQQSAEAGAVESGVLLERRIVALAHDYMRDRVDIGVECRTR